MSVEPDLGRTPSGAGDRVSRDAPRAPVAVEGLSALRRAHAAVPPGCLEACLLSLAASPLDGLEPVAVIAAGDVRRVVPAAEGGGAPLERAARVESWPRPGAARLAVVAGDAVAPGGTAIVWRLDGDTIFGPGVTADVVARLTSRVDAMIERAVASPGAPIAELVAVPERERRELLAWGRGAAAEPPAGTAADDVRRFARATPGAPALAAGGEVLSYAELDRRVDALAAGLLERGVGRGSRVAVALERGVDLVATMLAAWRLGAVYVPLDLAHPAERVARILADASCALFVHGRGRVPAPSGARWDIEGEPPPADARPLRPDEAGLGGEIAYVIYTSGSTGTPKGVEVEHAPLRNTIRAKVDLVAMRPGDAQLAVMSAAFDASIFELTMPLLVGARLAVAARGELEDFGALAAAIGRVGASVVGATPHTWRGLLEAGWRPPAGLRALVGGEALPPELGARLASFCRVFNMYGLTETAISSTYFEVGAGPAGATVPIGRALPNVLTRVVDPRGGLARVGEAGELYVGGLGLARGYRGGGALTSERFVGDPAGETGARFFRTGDRARVRHDGQLEYLGRLDAQVKVRGVRIELGEVEAALADAPGVAAVVADVRELDGEPRIVAYVKARGALAEAELRALAGRRLPPHMVPSAFVAIAQVPLTPNGKVDRAALPEPAAPASGGEGVAPGVGASDPLAAAVHEAFAAVLGRGCDLERDFATLGLDSLGRARVRQALARRGVEVALVDLFERRDAAELVAALRSRGDSPRAPAPPRPDYGLPRPVTMNQRHPILTHLANPGTGAWNCQIACTFEGDVDLRALEAAWRAVVARHGALRLGFQWRGLAYPTQSVVEGVAAPWSVLDLRGEGAAYARAFRDVQERELKTTFDVERPPLHRLCVVQAPDGSLDVVWTYFSALLDGWSSAIVFRDLVAHYDALASGGAMPPAKAPHFFDHLDRMAERDWSTSEPFFHEALAGYRPPPSIGRPPGGDDEERSTTTLPPDLRALFEALGDKPFRTRGVGAKSARLSEADTARLGLAAARHGVAESTLLHSAWAIALMREYGCDDILIGMVAANRPDYEAAVGKYTSLLPFRFRLDRPRPLADWLRSNERYVLETLAHEGIPARHWVGAIGLERWQFPFESTFTFVNYVGASGRGGGVRVAHCRQLDAGIPPAFGMVVIPGASHLVRLEYNLAGGFDEARLEGLFDTFVDAALRFAAAPGEADAASWLFAPLGARSLGVGLALL